MIYVQICFNSHSLCILGFGRGPDGSLQNEEICEGNQYLRAG